jgi:hypothetical protein
MADMLIQHTSRALMSEQFHRLADVPAELDNGSPISVPRKPGGLIKTIFTRSPALSVLKNRKSFVW